jgi:hypothetical protein
MARQECPGDKNVGWNQQYLTAIYMLQRRYHYSRLSIRATLNLYTTASCQTKAIDSKMSSSLLCVAATATRNHRHLPARGVRGPGDMQLAAVHSTALSPGSAGSAIH